MGLLAWVQNAIPLLYWRGLVSTDWGTAGNWALTSGGSGGAGVPDVSTNCIIADVYSSRDCYVGTNALCARILATRIGGSPFGFNLLAADMTIGSDFVIEGAIVVNRGSGDLTIGRDFLQSENSIFAFLTTLAGETPVMAVARDLIVDVAQGNFGPNKLAGHTITFGRSASFNRSDGNLLGLVGSSAWTLTGASGGGGTAVASNVNVGHSDASGGLQIDASDGTNTDSGNNLNWLFEVVVVPATAGPDYTFPLDRLHYTFPEDRPHYKVPLDRKHYVVKKG